MPENNNDSRPHGRHSVVMQDCMTVSLSGVSDADSFDENCVKLFTECGELTIFGDSLHVNEMNVDSGNVSVEGEIHALVYGGRSAKKKYSGILRRLLR